MKKLLSILLVGLLWCSISYANLESNFEWLKKQKDISNTNQLYWESNFKDLIKENIPNENIYLGMTNKEEISYLYDNFIKVLGGPPNEIKYYKGNKYLVATACRHQSCNEKGLIWIDLENNNLVGLILHYFYKDEKYDGNGNFLIFSNNYNSFKDIPEDFDVAVNEWIKDEKLKNPSKRRFIGKNNKISYVDQKHPNIIVKCKIESNSKEKVKWYHFNKEKIYFKFENERLVSVSVDNVEWNEINWITTFRQKIDKDNNWVTNIFEGMYISRLKDPMVTTYQLHLWDNYEGGVFFSTMYEVNQKALMDWVKNKNKTYKFFNDWQKRWNKKNTWQDKTRIYLYVSGECEKIN